MKKNTLKSNFIVAFLLSLSIYAQVPTPGGVEGTVLWLKANAGTNTTTNGVGITSWADQSGNGFNATGTGEAVYSTNNAINGNPVIYFTDDNKPITGSTITRGVGPNSSIEQSTSFVVQRKTAITDDCFIEFYDGASRQFYIDRRYDANEPFFTLPTGVQQIISVSDPGGSGPGANSTIYLNSKDFFTSENLFSTTWENGSYVVGDDDTGGNQLNGEIAEIIYFDYELSDTNRKKVESYLAIKYGITLDNTDGGTDGDYIISTGTTLWDASVNATYHNDVIGIGKDNGTALDQRKSTEFNTDPTLSIEKTTSFSSDLDYLIIGNDAASLAFTTSGVPSGITNKSGRTWKVETNGTPGTISVSFTLGTTLTNSGNPSEYALLIDSDTDFSTGATIHSSGASINGNVLTFTNVSLADGDFFTLTYTPVTEFPGAVSTGLTHWFKADSGTNTSVDGGAITTWEDQSTIDGSDNATKTGTNAVTYQTEIHNYNPSVLFQDGGDGHLNIANNLDQLAGTNYSIFAVTERTTDSSLGANSHNFFMGIETTADDEGFRLGYVNNTRAQLHHDGSGNNINVNLSAGFVDAATEQPTMFKAIHNQGTSRSLSILTALEATEITESSSNTNNLNSSTATGTIGRWRANRGFEGYVSEIIIYTDDLNAVDQLKVESYLAVKYALTLDNSGGGTDGDYTDSDANVIWDASANTTYHNEIIGIGRDDASSLNQLKSSEPISSTQLTIDRVTNFINNQDYLLVGHDNGVVGVTTSGTSPVYSERLTRTWKASVSGAVNGVTVSVTLPSGSTGDTKDYALLIDSDTDFSDSRIHTNGVSLDGDTVTFTNVNLADGDIFTVGIRLSFGPANVTTALTHWLRADTGTSTTTDGAAISQWDNLTGINHATQAGTSDFPTYEENIHNFNPSVHITNGDNGYFDLNLNDINNSNYNVIAIVERDNTESENYVLGTTANTSNQSLHFGYRENNSLALAQYGNDLDVVVNNYDTPSTSIALIRGQLDNGSGKIVQELRDGNLSENTDSSTAFLTGNNSGVLGRGYSTNGFQGYVSEVIAYNSTLSNVDLAKIYSYLAIKYGMTLDLSDGVTNGDYTDSRGSILWDASENSTYHNDVAGIGYDIASNLIQKQSKSESSDDILTISIYSSVTATNNLNLGSFDDNLDYLIWGNNGSTSSITLVDHISSQNACLKQFDRDWKISNSGNVEDITLQFDVSAFSSRDFNLIIDLDGDGDYTTGTIETVSTGSINGNNIVFTNVDLPNDCVFTLVDNSTDIVYKVGAWLGGSGTNGEFNDSTTDLTKSVKISEDVTLTDSHNCKCLIVANGAKVTVGTGEYLKVTHTLNSNGAIYLEGTSELIQTDTNTNSTTGQVYKILNEATSSIYRYNYFSSPVHTSGTFSIGGDLKINTGATLGNNTDPSFITNDLDGFGTTFSTRWFHTMINDYDFTEIDENTTMIPGIGFTMKGTGQSNAYNLIGTPNNGNVNIVVSSGRFLLTGNPYPSTISANAFNTANSSSTDGTIYLWDQPTDVGDHFPAETDNSGGYATITNGVAVAAAKYEDESTTVPDSTVPSLFIKPGQGFIVYSTSGGTVSYTNAMRDGVTYDESRKFFKTQETKTLNNIKPMVRLGFEYKTEDAKVYHRQLVTALEGNTLAKELGKDAFMFDYYNNDAYWIVEDDIDRFIITSVPYVSESLELPIGVVLESEREVTFKIDDVQDLYNDVYLLDKQEATVNKISTTESYTTMVSSGEHQDRFSLVFKESKNLDTDYIDNTTKSVIYIQDKVMNVVVEQGNIQQIDLYNLAGQKIITKTSTIITNNSTISLESLAEQLYVVKIVTGSGSFTQKIVLE